ncbi:hypothetical protein FJTKL_07403 [Diaporthe vaccinii]|uniref:Uncharacterized protein n=1 Tax=Diaporthe vaccinii TaxID=105482 RepID=A0ABR4EUC9_9PEZI
MDPKAFSLNAPESLCVNKSGAIQQTLCIAAVRPESSTKNEQPDQTELAKKAALAMITPDMARHRGNKTLSLPEKATIPKEDNGYDDNVIFPRRPVSNNYIGDKVSEDVIVVRFANKAAEPGEEAPAALCEKGGSAIIEERVDKLNPLTYGFHKRKWSDVFVEPTKGNTDECLLADEPDDGASSAPGLPATAPRSAKCPRTDHSGPSAKGVILGYWRDSKAPIEDKHIVKGFIDHLDRLRTHAQPCNRDGEDVTALYPLGPGPGGKCISFEKIVFDNHLVHLDQGQVKEYVRNRLGVKDNSNDGGASDTVAVQQAIQRCKGMEPQGQNCQPLRIAYGVDIPDHALNRPEKRRRTGATSSANLTRLTKVAPGQPQPQIAVLHGTRPTKILLGFWKGSAEQDDENKHAVFGILGKNDTFRVKLGRETRDGRPLQSNFPSGAGALWVSSDQYQTEDYLEGLSRMEIKEYCRVRQHQLDRGERPENRDNNRRLAIEEARTRVDAVFIKPEPREDLVSTSVERSLDERSHTDRLEQGARTRKTRQARARRTGPSTVSDHALQLTQPPTFRAANRSSSVHFRINDLAVNAVAHVEARQSKNDQRGAARLSPPCPQGDADGDTHKQSFMPHSVSRPNRVWADTKANRLRDNTVSKVYMGIKYERKRTGPLEGKLVSRGVIISIEGEDYVEYRVLTKPIFV